MDVFVLPDTLRDVEFVDVLVSLADKVVAAYEALVLSILLYGVESWCLTEHLYDRLRVFHARCLRCICYVSRKHTREHHISTESLMKQLGVSTRSTSTWRGGSWAGRDTCAAWTLTGCRAACSRRGCRTSGRRARRA